MNLDELPVHWNDWNTDTLESIKSNDNESEILVCNIFSNSQSNDSFQILSHKIHGIGFQLWPAAIVLCRWLGKKSIEEGKNLVKGKSVLELGSGVGLCGMYAKRVLGASYVCCTDLESVVPHLKENVKLNGLETEVDCKMLEWGNTFRWESGLEHAHFDIVLLSDCLYHEHLYEPLFQTLLVLANNVNVFYLCQKHRWLHSEKKFFKRIAKHFTYSIVGELKFDEQQRRFEHVYEIKKR